MREVNEKAKEAYDLLSKVSGDAYHDGYLISNSVLSKSPYTSLFLERFIDGWDAPKPSAWMAARKMIWYYVKSALHLCAYLLRFFEWRLANLKFVPAGGSGELVLIDSPFLMDNIASSSEFKDTFFPGLETVLKNKRRPYAYAPIFYSSAYHKRPFELLRTLRIAKEQKLPLITEYQLLSFSDILKLLWFTAAYPFHLCNYIRRRPAGTSGERLVRFELVNTLDDVTFYSFARYLFGRRLAGMPYKAFKVISWYENQPFNKQLYRGMRSRRDMEVKIFGAQLFLYSENHLNLIPDENENAFGVVPDVILRNGPSYIPEEKGLDYRVGPSLRYDNLLRSDIIARPKSGALLVLLPYYSHEIKRILKILCDAGLGSRDIFIKAHPAAPISGFRGLIPDGAKIVDDSLDKLFASTRMVIGSASGTMVEAASSGIPVIAVKSCGPIEFNNPLPSAGRGLIWEEVDSAVTLTGQIKGFDEILAERQDDVIATAKMYRDMFFCKPTEECVIKAFEL